MFVLFLASSVPARAQVGANVGGVVGDSSGATIAGATVTITNTSNGESQTLTTGPGGNYRAVNLQPAPYLITVTASGFETQKKSITLLVGTDPTVDFTLTVGQMLQEVNVSEAATTIEVSKSEPSSVINDQQIDSLPGLSRDFLVIAQTMPGSTTITNIGAYPAYKVPKFVGVADQQRRTAPILN